MSKHVAPVEKCCSKAIVCWACAGDKHHLCVGCHGCGCVTSAQAAAAHHGYPLTGKKP